MMMMVVKMDQMVALEHTHVQRWTRHTLKYYYLLHAISLVILRSRAVTETVHHVDPKQSI